MANRSNTRTFSWSHLLTAAGCGVALGVMAHRNQLEEARRSRAERDDPAGAEEVYAEIGDLLDAWKPDPSCETEDDFTQDLAQWLEENTEWEVEVYANTREGRPDILIGDILALELKCSPCKGDLDRCVGQCAAYSRQWITWMVIVDATASEVGRLEDLLEDKHLAQIEVWRFA